MKPMSKSRLFKNNKPNMVQEWMALQLEQEVNV